MYFASDNSSGAHPKIMEAVQKANADYAMPYGSDPIMDEVRQQIRDIFEAAEAAVYLVATGSAANALALACMCQPWQTIFAHREAHIDVDECGAPMFYTGGAKIELIDGEDAKLSPAALHAAIEKTGQLGVHNPQRGPLSLTNLTEAGATYTPAEVRALADVAHSFGVGVHMDGARFTNALVATGASAAEMTWKAGVDAVSFGGTKNGCLGVEAVILFDPKVAWEFELRRKRGGHLFSKHRYLSAQMNAYLKDDLWLEMARHANVMGKRLSDGILQIEGGELLHPTDANQVFARWPRKGHQKAHEAGAAYYFWPFDHDLAGDPDALLGARAVASWSTTERDVDTFLELISGG